MRKKDNHQILEEDKLKECFIITPIGSTDSEIFKKTEGLIKSVLAPVLKEFGFTPMPAHHIDSTGSINKQIIEKIVNSELVIANLTGINPNVMYELAIRHSFGKRVITVAELGTKLPFDIIDQRTIFYSDSMHGSEKFKPELTKAIRKCLEENLEVQNVSNPVFDAVKQIAEIKSLPFEDRNALMIILDKLNDINNFSRPRNLIYSNTIEGLTGNYELILEGNDVEPKFDSFVDILMKSRTIFNIKKENGYIRLELSQISKFNLEVVIGTLNDIYPEIKITIIEIGGI